MVRTIISLDERDKEWLDRRAARDRKSRTELIRQAVKLLRKQAEDQTESFEALLEKTRGTWTQGDGLAWQRKIRDEGW